MRTPVVAGNWKMNGSSGSIDELLDGMVAELDAPKLPGCEVMVFPAYVYLARVVGRLAATGIAVGAQDTDQRPEGAVTGGVSVGMLCDVGCSHAIVGHSERRQLFGETDDIVAEKFEACVEGGLQPIICVGETLEERQQDRTLDVVTRQLQAVLRRVGQSGFEAAMVAYEPVWAIGTGESASPAQAEEVHAALRHCLAEVDAGLAERTRVLYGGSVTPENAVALFRNDNVDGALVGGASLDPGSFAAICRAAAGNQAGRPG